MTHRPIACGQVVCGTTRAETAPETERPAARASGTLPTRPIRTVVTAAASAVAVVSAAWSSVAPVASAPLRMSGLSRMM